MEKNVGKKDAIVRLVLAAIFVGLGVYLLSVNSTISIGLFVFSFMLLMTSLVGRCGLYKVFGINTCPIDKR